MLAAFPAPILRREPQPGEAILSMAAPGARSYLAGPAVSTRA